jgi:threonine aldolase
VTASDALASLTPPERSFASDNTAGAHPDVVEALAAANVGHVPSYGADPWTGDCAARFDELFGGGTATFLTFGGTGANVVALHTVACRDSLVICTSDAHIALDEAGAPEHITGAQLVGYQWGDDGKLTARHVADAAARLRRVHVGLADDVTHVVSVTQATEVGTCYSPAELAAVAEEAHRHGMVVHVDGARIGNAFAAWGVDLATGCGQLRACGVDVVAFGGTKAGLFGAEAVVFLDRSMAVCAEQRRKQATQTASKMRFLAAQMLCALDGDRIIAWSARANDMAERLEARLVGEPGVALGYPRETNVVLVTLPPDAVEALAAWTPFYVWDPARDLVRFVTAWDTTADDVDRLASGVEAACASSRRVPARTPSKESR